MENKQCFVVKEICTIDGTKVCITVLLNIMIKIYKAFQRIRQRAPNISR